MNKKILIGVGAVVLLGGVYKFVLSPAPAPVKVKPHVAGVLLPLDKEFMVNLSGGSVAKVNVALLLNEKDPAAGLAEAYNTAGSGPVPLHPQNAMIRSVITADLVGISAAQLNSLAERRVLLKEINADLERQTDAKVDAVIFTDVVTDG